MKKILSGIACALLASCATQTAQQPQPPKIESIRAEETREANARGTAVAQPDKTAIPSPTASRNDNPIQVQRAAGKGFIIDDAQAPFPAAEFIGANVWTMRLDAERTLAVFAGYGRDPSKGGDADTSRGELRVLELAVDISPDPNSAGIYPTPKRSGKVHIVDANGMVLKVRAENGDSFYFDVETRKYL
jgi:hypothetical protein